jgi:hypothetical protein
LADYDLVLATVADSEARRERDTCAARLAMMA